MFRVLQVGKESVTYQNEIFLQSEFHKGENALDGSHELQRYLPIKAGCLLLKAHHEPSCYSVVLECTYPLDGLHHFFWTYIFECETAGVGRIVYAKQPGKGT